jgi:hypothetical protein
MVILKEMRIFQNWFYYPEGNKALQFLLKEEDI